MITRENYEIWFLDYAEGRLTAAQQRELMAFLQANPDLQAELDNFDTLALNDLASEPVKPLKLKKKQSWLLDKYSTDELVFNVCESNLNAEELREWDELVKTMPELAKQAEAEKRLVLKPLAETFGGKVLLKRETEVPQTEITPANYNEHFIQYAETKNLALYIDIQSFLQKHPGLRAEFELAQKLVLKPDTSVVFENKKALYKREKVAAFYTWRYVALAAACMVLAVLFFRQDGQQAEQLQAGTKDSLEKVPGNVMPQAPQPGNNMAENNAHNNAAEEVENNGENTAGHNQGFTNNSSNKGQQHENNSNTNNNTSQPVNNQQPLRQPANNPEKGNFANVPNSNKQQNNVVKDSARNNTPVLPGIEPKQDMMANNTTPAQKQDNSTVIESPLQFVAGAINKQYKNETPKGEETSSFYAMRNVVKTVSNGNADINKKEDKNSKEFSVKIGNFGFSRKKSK